MTNLAFEITTDDIENVVFQEYDKNISWTVASDIMDFLNLDTVSSDALNADTIDGQTQIAMNEISNQIKKSKEIQDILSRA